MNIGILFRWMGQHIRRTKVRHISPAEVRSRLGSGEMTLIDATLRPQWLRGHIAGAIHIGFDDRYEESVLPADKKKMLVFYCESAI
jgi:rhodanese-related sulfurtransferase